MGRRAWWIAGAAIVLGVAAAAVVVMMGPSASSEGPHARLARVEGPPPEAQAPTGARNVLLIIGCTLRRDQATPYAADIDSMPFLASLADRGARFDDLVTAAPWTKAASTAILTSHHALSIGMVEEGPRRNDRVLPDDVSTLAERFRGAGYHTVGATANPNLHTSYGFHRGFRWYVQPTDDWHSAGGVKVPGTRLADALLADLEEVDGRPYFAQALFVDAHSPFPEAEPIEGLPDTVARYRRGLGRLDDAIEHLMAGLEERGLLDDTIVMVVNDHGEGLRYPDHHGKSHGRYLSPSTVAGVGIVVGPGVPAGHHVTGVASQVDLGPTLWSLAGLAPSDSWGTGLDLAAVVRGERQGTGRRRAYVDTWFRKVSRAAFYETDRTCQVVGRDFQLTDVNGITFHVGCFDRQADPEHRRPVRDAAAMRDLNQWRLSEHAKGLAREVRRAEASDGLDEQLKALGYLD